MVTGRQWGLGCGPWVLPPGHLRLWLGQGWTRPQGPNSRRAGHGLVERSGHHSACAPSLPAQTASSDAYEGTWQEVTFAGVSAWPCSLEEPPPPAPRKREGAARPARNSLLCGFTVWGAVGVRMC